MKAAALCIALSLAVPIVASAQNADAKPPAGDAKPAAAESKPAEVKPAEVKPIEVKPIEVKPIEIKRARVTFLDSKLFDGQLSKELGGNNDAVEIDFLGRVSLNNIPQRIDRWISIVGENGAVNLKPAEQGLKPKFLFDIVELIYTGVQRSNEEKMLDPVRKYDAVIFYTVDAAGEPRIAKIVFNRRKQ